jgi:protein-disulfide isomerase
MKNLTTISIILVVIIGLFLIIKTSYTKSQEKQEAQNTEQAQLLAIKPDDHVYGNPNSPVVLVEYLDFECEACGRAYPTTTQLKEEYKDKIAFVPRYFPLPGHRNSRTAAHAVEAAAIQGKFWEMYDLVFQAQTQWGEQQNPNQEQFEKYALQAGVDIEKWRVDVMSTAVMDRVEKSYQEGVKLGLQGTPSFFLAGKSISTPAGIESFKVLVDKELEKSTNTN